MRADKVMNRKHSMQILNEIRSEINSGSEYESQSEVNFLIPILYIVLRVFCNHQSVLVWQWRCSIRVAEH
jgi:hypothetical protein